MSLIYVTQLPKAPARPSDAHKGTFGSVLVLAGSRGMSGAACLAGLGSLRGGSGLTTVGVPREIQPIVSAVEPSYLTIALEQDPAGRLSGAARRELDELLDRYDALAFGSGWGRSAGVSEIARWLYLSAELPAVVDADGLNALAEMREVLAQAPAPRVLTPHPGEFARLIDSDIPTVQANRESLASDFARENRVVLVLKGAGTIVADGERLYTNTTGNSGMATGGSGDVLTGLTAALLAQKMPPFEAAQLAVYLHGLAGDIAAAEMSQPGLIASDLAHYLTSAWLQLG
jgi:NAD(P)H-hydrate epimerase